MNGITTITGYGSAFRSFSYFGFILFYILGLIIGKFMYLSNHSNFYLFIYVSCLIVIPNMITHSLQYMFARLEFIYIFLFPILLFFTFKSKNREVKPNRN
jgi:uncharacterized membrane protein YcaP (DUF421 family)